MGCSIKAPLTCQLALNFRATSRSPWRVSIICQPRSAGIRRCEALTNRKANHHTGTSTTRQKYVGSDPNSDRDGRESTETGDALAAKLLQVLTFLGKAVETKSHKTATRWMDDDNWWAECGGGLLWEKKKKKKKKTIKEGLHIVTVGFDNWDRAGKLRCNREPLQAGLWGHGRFAFLLTLLARTCPNPQVSLNRGLDGWKPCLKDIPRLTDLRSKRRMKGTSNGEPGVGG